MIHISLLVDDKKGISWMWYILNAKAVHFLWENISSRGLSICWLRHGESYSFRVLKKSAFKRNYNYLFWDALVLGNHTKSKVAGDLRFSEGLFGPGKTWSLYGFLTPTGSYVQSSIFLASFRKCCAPNWNRRSLLRDGHGGDVAQYNTTLYQTHRR